MSVRTYIYTILLVATLLTAPATATISFRALDDPEEEEENACRPSCMEAASPANEERTMTLTMETDSSESSISTDSSSGPIELRLLDDPEEEEESACRPNCMPVSSPTSEERNVTLTMETDSSESSVTTDSSSGPIELRLLDDPEEEEEGHGCRPNC